QRLIRVSLADDRKAQSRFDERAAGLVVQGLQRGRSRTAGAVAAVDEGGEALGRQHHAVAAAAVLQLAGLERAGVVERERVVQAERVVDRRAGEIFERASRLAAAVVDARDGVDRFLLDLDHERGGALVGGRRLQAVLELQPRQV